MAATQFYQEESDFVYIAMELTVSYRRSSWLSALWSKSEFVRVKDSSSCSRSPSTDNLMNYRYLASMNNTAGESDQPEEDFS